MEYLQFFIPIIGMLANALSQIFIFRFFPKKGLLKAVIIAFFIGFFCLFILETYIFVIMQKYISVFLLDIFIDLLIYVSLSYCFFHFINLGETGRRIRILSELYYANDGFFMEDILKQYNGDEVLEKRIKRLTENGQIVFKNGKYFIGKSTVLLMAKLMLGIKWLFFNQNAR